VIYDLEHKETKSDTLTFRIEHGLVNDLRSESIEKGESLNVLMNQILKDYVSYYKPAKKAGNIHFPRVLISGYLIIFPTKKLKLSFKNIWATIHRNR
jgi:hypothetical protein